MRSAYITSLPHSVYTPFLIDIPQPRGNKRNTSNHLFLARQRKIPWAPSAPNETKQKVLDARSLRSPTATLIWNRNGHENNSNIYLRREHAFKVKTNNCYENTFSNASYVVFLNSFTRFLMEALYERRLLRYKNPAKGQSACVCYALSCDTPTKP